jgi:hypothetical protein
LMNSLPICLSSFPQSDFGLRVVRLRMFFWMWN